MSTAEAPQRPCPAEMQEAQAPSCSLLLCRRAGTLPEDPAYLFCLGGGGPGGLGKPAQALPQQEVPGCVSEKVDGAQVGRTPACEPMSCLILSKLPIV